MDDVTALGALAARALGRLARGLQRVAALLAPHERAVLEVALVPRQPVRPIRERQQTCSREENRLHEEHET